MLLPLLACRCRSSDRHDRGWKLVHERIACCICSWGQMPEPTPCEERRSRGPCVYVEAPIFFSGVPLAGKWFAKTESKP